MLPAASWRARLASSSRPFIRKLRGAVDRVKAGSTALRFIGAGNKKNKGRKAGRGNGRSVLLDVCA